MNRPTYSLEKVKSNLLKGNYRITFSALKDAIAIGLDEDDILSIGLCLADSDFKKTMVSEKRTGTMQDVYNPVFGGIQLYYKIQLVEQVIIISCKRK